MLWRAIPQSYSVTAFWSLHPVHVLLSALVTAGMYRRHSRGRIATTFLIGYFGSIGIATLSDSIIPFLGEWLLNLPDRAVHIGFLEKWWLVNPLALLGVTVACVWPKTKVPHAGHVLLSTWASLFHMTMSVSSSMSGIDMVLVLLFLFLAVWIPCCTSDIVFPLLFGQHRPPGSILSRGNAPRLEGREGLEVRKIK